MRLSMHHWSNSSSVISLTLSYFPGIFTPFFLSLFLESLLRSLVSSRTLVPSFPLSFFASLSSLPFLFLAFGGLLDLGSRMVRQKTFPNLPRDRKSTRLNSSHQII